MPRPGPRPYECVRRAWHSDRHQPIRGSLIQEIFRLANEVHCNGTRKNKEWQEKLPFVVLKAEEIMYSKANSEAEYMDLKTLWDRANDAIDTIIRKDDANESEDLLQPCIEAALNLGCIPRRASRSQRHSNPVCYLSPNSKEASDASQKTRDNKKVNQVSSTSMLPPLLPTRSHLNFSPPQFALKSPAFGPEIQFMPSNASKELTTSFENSNKEFPCIVRGLPAPKESCIWPNLGRVYPLYHGGEHCTPNSQSQSHTIPQELMIFSPDTVVRKTSNLPPHIECDLSLRLSPPSPPASEVESSWAHEAEDAGSSSSCDGSKSCGPLSNGAGTVILESSLSSARDKGFDFFSVDNVDERCESCSSRWSSQGDCAAYRTNACDKSQKLFAGECFGWKS